MLGAILSYALTAFLPLAAAVLLALNWPTLWRHRRLLTLAAGAAIAAGAGAPARAHFVFVVPDADGRRATVVFSEDLQPDEGVKVDGVRDLRLVARPAAGVEAPVDLKPAGDHALAVDAIAPGTRLVRGDVVFGVQQRGKDARPFLLTYHPKAVLGDGLDAAAAAGDAAAAEIVPTGRAGAVRFTVLLRGKPVPAAEVNVLLPDGKTAKARTDD
ncbi:MAG TPA: hypothetical protein VF796_07240, partial [Humisphaera sp.]